MRDVVSYLLKRAAWMVLTLWAVYTVSFILMRSVSRQSIQQRTKFTAFDRTTAQSPLQLGCASASAVLGLLGGNCHAV